MRPTKMSEAFLQNYLWINSTNITEIFLVGCWINPQVILNHWWMFGECPLHYSSLGFFCLLHKLRHSTSVNLPSCSPGIYTPIAVGTCWTSWSQNSQTIYHHPPNVGERRPSILIVACFDGAKKKHTAERTCVAFHPALARTKRRFHFENHLYMANWWFQPPWKHINQIGSLIPTIGENKKCSKPPTRWNCSIAMVWILLKMVCDNATWAYSQFEFRIPYSTNSKGKHGKLMVF